MQEDYVVWGAANFRKIENCIGQDAEVRLFVLETLKAQGNAHFLSQRYQKAREKYLQAIALFRHQRPGSRVVVTEQTMEHADEFAHVRELLETTFINLAAVYLQTHSSLEAAAAANEALTINPNNRMGLYQRAKALMGLPVNPMHTAEVMFILTYAQRLGINDKAFMELQLQISPFVAAMERAAPAMLPHLCQKIALDFEKRLEAARHPFVDHSERSFDSD